MAINNYEVEVLVKTREKGEHLVTRKEPAYCVVDAMQQAIVNIMGESPVTEIVRVRHISPPMPDVLASMQNMLDTVGFVAKGILGTSPEAPRDPQRK